MSVCPWLRNAHKVVVEVLAEAAGIARLDRERMCPQVLMGPLTEGTNSLPCWCLHRTSQVSLKARKRSHVT